MYVPSVKVASVYLSQLPALFFLNQSPLPESIQKYAGAPVVTVTVGFLYAPPYTGMVAISEVPSTLFTFVRSAGFSIVFPTVRVMFALAGVPALSVTQITRFSFAPAAVGVPETVPSGATCSQAGPETLEKVYGAVPPVAPLATEKGVIATPFFGFSISHALLFTNASGVPAGAVTVYSGESAHTHE